MRKMLLSEMETMTDFGIDQERLSFHSPRRVVNLVRHGSDRMTIPRFLTVLSVDVVDALAEILTEFKSTGWRV
jgi:hypothetical protein